MIIVSHVSVQYYVYHQRNCNIYISSKKANDKLPVELKTFTNLVLSDCGPEMDKGEKIHWLVCSIGEDIWWAVTNGNGNCQSICSCTQLSVISTAINLIQKIMPDANPSSERTLPLYDRSKKRSLKLEIPEAIPPVTIYNRKKSQNSRECIIIFSWWCIVYWSTNIRCGSCAGTIFIKHIFCIFNTEKVSLSIHCTKLSLTIFVYKRWPQTMVNRKSQAWVASSLLLVWYHAFQKIHH